MGERDERQFYKTDGKDVFFEVMTSCLFMEQVFINFAKYNKAKAAGQKMEKQVPIYLPVFEAYILSKDIFSGKLAMLGEKARKKAKDGGYQYCNPIYTSLGGTPAKKLAERGNDRKDGKALSRQFKITPGTDKPWIISGESGPGREEGNGLIVPDYKGAPEAIVRVPLMNDNQLKEFGVALELLCNAWAVERVHQLGINKPIK